ncbi:MAG: glycosyltransferase family 4 protein [Ferruginibacter sp.]
MNNVMLKIFAGYTIPFIILIIVLVLYFRIANHFKIIDKPNERSSHTDPTIRGGGIIFLLAVILFFFWSGFTYPFLLFGLLISGIVSFIDDIRPLPNLVKFSAHLASVVLIFKETGIVSSIHPLYLVAIAILMIGVINAYNFMDGINGITGLYSLAVIFPLCLTETNDQLQSLDIFLLMGLLVFNFFNTRKKARCFAGDVGSISLAIAIVFLLIMRVQSTGNFTFIGMLLIYGIDAVYTIVQRLYQRENIFKPHRKHLYQYFSNEKKIPHVRVSIIYALTQLLINLAIVYSYLNFLNLLLLLISLSVIYWSVKMPLIKKFTTS